MYKKAAEAHRENYVKMRALELKHIDEMFGKTTGTDNFLAFLQDTYEQVQAGKDDNLADLGHSNPSEATRQHVLDNYQKYKKVVEEIGTIYDDVKDYYNKSFVAPITMDRYNLKKLQEEAPVLSAVVAESKKSLFQYDALSSLGKEAFDTNYHLKALAKEEGRLTELYRDTTNEYERVGVDARLKEVKKMQLDMAARRDELLKKESGLTEVDRNILKGDLESKGYTNALYIRHKLDSGINIKTHKLSLWNNEGYQTSVSRQKIENAETQEGLDDVEASLKNNKLLSGELKKAIVRKRKEIDAKEIEKTIDAKNDAERTKVARDTETQKNKDALEAEKTLAEKTKVVPVADESSFEEGMTNIQVVDAAHKAANEVKTEEPTVSEFIDKPIIYKGKRARIYQDGQTLVAKIEGENREYELGNVDALKDTPISELGIGIEESVVGVDADGNITVRGITYINNYSNPLAAINTNDEGDVVSVDLETVDGKREPLEEI